MKEIWILITGSRDVRDEDRATKHARSLLLPVIEKYGTDYVHVVHGQAAGIDTIFHTVATELGVKVEPWPANLFSHPFIRNKFMVQLISNMQDHFHDDAVCWAFARTWASGTGNCARYARQCGLHVVDYGVSTAPREERS